MVCVGQYITDKSITTEFEDLGPNVSDQKALFLVSVHYDKTNICCRIWLPDMAARHGGIKIDTPSFWWKPLLGSMTEGSQL